MKSSVDKAFNLTWHRSHFYCGSGSIVHRFFWAHNWQFICCFCNVISYCNAVNTFCTCLSSYAVTCASSKCCSGVCVVTTSTGTGFGAYGLCGWASTSYMIIYDKVSILSFFSKYTISDVPFPFHRATKMRGIHTNFQDGEAQSNGWQQSDSNAASRFLRSWWVYPSKAHPGKQAWLSMNCHREIYGRADCELLWFTWWKT